MATPEDPDRPRGILTEADREFLLGNADVSERTATQKRYRIRNRIREAIVDFVLIEEHLSSQDRAQIYEDEDLSRGLQEMLSFVYRGCEQTDRSFLLLLKFAIEDAVAREGKTAVDIDVSIDVDTGISMKEAQEVVERRGVHALLDLDLTRGELSQLYTGGVLSEEEYEELRNEF